MSIKTLCAFYGNVNSKEEKYFFIPIFQIDTNRTFSTVQVPVHAAVVKALSRRTARKSPPQVKQLLDVLQGEMTRVEIMNRLGLKDRTHFSKAYLIPAMSAGLVEMTLPDKPKSRLQKYRLTQLGLAFKKLPKGTTLAET